MTKSLDELLPIVKAKALEFQALCKKSGIDIIFTGTYRSREEQDKLYNQPFDHIDNDGDGRIDEGDEKVTLARGGQSYHNHRVAFDVVPVVYGKAIWNNAQLWAKLGKLGQSIGLEWGGSWEQFPDVPHFQYTLGYNWMQLSDGTADLTKFNLQTKHMDEIKTTTDNAIYYEIIDKNTKEVFPVNHLTGDDVDKDNDMDLVVSMADGTRVAFTFPGHLNDQYLIRSRDTHMSADGLSKVEI